ncbi:MAG: hypothetical protein ACFE0Q_07425 [Anaerolineae bacterium]
MDFLVFVHERLFFAQMFYSFAIGVYAAWLSAGKKELSGNFFGTIAVYSVLNLITFIIGLVLLFNGYHIASNDRTLIYILYMLYLIVILPGIFSIMSGRSDRSAGLIFGVSAMFNAAVSFSMFERGLASWITML